VQAVSNDYTAKLGRDFHPLRLQRWAFSDLNPWLWWLGASAGAVKAQRQAVAADDPARQVEKAMSEVMSASLEYYRALRDAASEAAFFLIYGTLFGMYMAERHEADAARQPGDPRELPFVQEALASIASGGYPEAVARVAFLLARKGEPLPLSRLQLKQELMGEYKDLLPDVARDVARRIRGEQEIIVRYEPDKSVDTLPSLLAGPGDRDRLLQLLERLLSDRRVQDVVFTPDQVAMLDRIRAVLGAPRLPRMVAA
jgi:hypothetical protein